MMISFFKYIKIKIIIGENAVRQVLKYFILWKQVNIVSNGLVLVATKSLTDFGIGVETTSIYNVTRQDLVKINILWLAYI